MQIFYRERYRCDKHKNMQRVKPLDMLERELKVFQRCALYLPVTVVVIKHKSWKNKKHRHTERTEHRQSGMWCKYWKKTYRPDRLKRIKTLFRRVIYTCLTHILTPAKLNHTSVIIQHPQRFVNRKQRPHRCADALMVSIQKCLISSNRFVYYPACKVNRRCAKNYQRTDTNKCCKHIIFLLRFCFVLFLYLYNTTHLRTFQYTVILQRVV